MKKVFGFKVQLNDKTVCRAGFEKDSSVVTCILDSIRRKNDNSEELNITIGGLNSNTNQHVDWFNESLQYGDKILVEIISDNFDSPISIREPMSEKDLIAQKLKRFYKLKEELKEHLEE